MSRLILGPTQSPLQWVLGAQQPGREADHSHLVRRIRMSEPIPPLTPHAYMACTGSNVPFALYFVTNVHENTEIKTPSAMIPCLCYHSVFIASVTISTAAMDDILV